jgi:hypothetical protein
MKKLLLFIFALLSFTVRSQGHLGISPYTFNIYADTTDAGSLDSADVYLVNKDTALPFAGPLEIHVAVQDSGTVSFHMVDTLFFAPLSIAPGDSAMLTLYQVFDIAPTKYHYDINVIVIWPVAASVSMVDSLMFPVYIQVPDGIEELDLEGLINTFPNPASEEFQIKNESGLKIEEVRIYNSSGQLISYMQPAGRINMSSWSKGTYLVNLKLSNKKSITLRVMKR